MLKSIRDTDCYMKSLDGYRNGDYYTEGLIIHFHRGKYDNDESGSNCGTKRFKEMIIFDIGMQWLDSKKAEIENRKIISSK